MRKYFFIGIFVLLVSIVGCTHLASRQMEEQTLKKRIDSYLQGRQYKKARKYLERELRKEKPKEVCGPDKVCRLRSSKRALEIKRLLVRVHYLSGALGSTTIKKKEIIF